MSPARPPVSICLNMIVRNERAVLERCLASVRPLISHWVIVDTGSSDGTQELAQRCLRDLPGRLVERPWVNFGHNRSEALALAAGSAEFLLVIDADEVLEFEPGFAWPDMSADGYAIETRLNGVSYQRTQLVRASGDWRYVGVVHECIAAAAPKTVVPLAGVVNRPHPDGARSADPNKFRRDALALEAALLDEPDHPRHLLYLANSYRDARDPEAALKHYRRRAELGAEHDEEAWYAAYQAGLMLVLLGRPWEQALAALLEAWARRPQRAEPLYRLAVHYRSAEQYPLAELYAERAAAIAYPAGALFVERDVYAWRLAFERAICAYWGGRHADAVRLNNQVLTHPDATPEVRAQALKNRRYSLDALYRSGSAAALPRRRELHVVVPFRNPGTAFDNCIASLLRQRGPACTLHFVDLGSSDGSAGQVPLDDPRARLERAPSAAAARRAVAASCAPDDVVLQLDGGDWLAHDDALATLAALYDAHGCDALIAQYRDADGALGRALPWPDAAALAQAGAGDLAYALCSFRAGAMRGADSGTGGDCGSSGTASTGTANAGAGVDPADDDGPAWLAPLLRRCAYDRVRFCDEVLVVRGEAAAAAPGG